MLDPDSKSQTFSIQNDDLIVTRGRPLDISVIQNGDLAVESGATATISGILNGTATVRNGTLHVIGVVNGDVINIGGNLTIDPTADVKGTVTNQEP
ncbi:MAG: hypothetical protein WKF81_00480 [Thermomicrobiales bacterium]